jgi:hypothetical protein
VFGDAPAQPADPGHRRSIGTPDAVNGTRAAITRLDGISIDRYASADDHITAC